MFDRRDALFDKTSSWFSLVDPARCSTEFGEVCKATSRHHILHYLEAFPCPFFVPLSFDTLASLRASGYPSVRQGNREITLTIGC